MFCLAFLPFGSSQVHLFAQESVSYSVRGDTSSETSERRSTRGSRGEGMPLLSPQSQPLRSSTDVPSTSSGDPGAGLDEMVARAVAKAFADLNKTGIDNLKPVRDKLKIWSCD